MTLLTDEQIHDACFGGHEEEAGGYCYRCVVLALEAQLKKVLEMLDGIENPHDDVCDAFGVECPFKGDARSELIQTIKQAIEVE